jgi:hypothetical protein
MKVKCIRCEILDRTYYIGFMLQTPVCYFNINLPLEHNKPQSYYIQKALDKLKPTILEHLKHFNEEPALGQMYEI